MDNDRYLGAIGTFFVVGFSIVGLITLMFWGFPTYNVWTKEMGGKAQLAEAEFSKQIKIEEAKSNLEAQKLNAQAEIERAKEEQTASGVQHWLWYRLWQCLQLQRVLLPRLLRSGEYSGRSIDNGV